MIPYRWIARALPYSSEIELAKAIGKRSKASNRRGESRIDDLLDIAAEAFLELGYERTSVGDIAHRAGASKETFYSRFKTKDDLFSAVMRRLMDKGAGDIRANLAAQEHPRKVLARFGSSILELVLSDVAVALQRIMFMEAARFPIVAKTFFECGPNRTTAALARYLQLQTAQKQLRRMDYDLAATQFIGLVVTDLVMRRTLGLLSPLTLREKSRRVKSAVDIFLQAYSCDL